MSVIQLYGMLALMYPISALSVVIQSKADNKGTLITIVLNGGKLQENQPVCGVPLENVPLWGLFHSPETHDNNDLHHVNRSSTLGC